MEQENFPLLQGFSGSKESERMKRFSTFSVKCINSRKHIAFSALRLYNNKIRLCREHDHTGKSNKGG